MKNLFSGRNSTNDTHAGSMRIFEVVEALSNANTRFGQEKFMIFVDTPTQYLALTRSTQEIIDLHAELWYAYPDVHFPALPSFSSLESRNTGKLIKRRSGFINTLSTLSKLANLSPKLPKSNLMVANKSGKNSRISMDSYRNSHKNRFVTPMRQRSQSTSTWSSGDEEPGLQITSALKEYLGFVNDHSVLQYSRTWCRFTRVRTGDLRGTLEERSVRRVRSEGEVAGCASTCGSTSGSELFNSSEGGHESRPSGLGLNWGSTSTIDKALPALPASRGRGSWDEPCTVPSMSIATPGPNSRRTTSPASTPLASPIMRQAMETPLPPTPSKPQRERVVSLPPVDIQEKIGVAMPSSTVIHHLVQHGCCNITEDLELPSCSQYPISVGGFGDVYRGRLNSGVRVAIKCMRLIDGEQRERKDFKNAAREIHTWSKLHHPCVLKLIGLVEYRGQIGMVSPWIEGGSLLYYLARNPCLDRPQLCMKIADGLSYLHECGVTHGDLKGANVLMSNEGGPMLADFGNALLQGCSIQFTHDTQKSSLSFRWSAPELLRGAPSSFEADVYALGMTMLEAVTGNIPYVELSHDMAVIFATARNEYPKRPEQYLPSESKDGDEMWRIITRCWIPEPQFRPKAAYVRDTLKAFTNRNIEHQSYGIKQVFQNVS